MTFILSKRSLSNLVDVHPDLVDVVKTAIKITDVDFMVTEGVRSVEKQRELYKAGATRTMNSRHLTGHAVDVAAIVGRDVSWDWPLYERIAIAMKTAAASLDVSIIWGGDWTTFKDGPHFELERKVYR